VSLGENHTWADENEQAARVLHEALDSPLIDTVPAIKVRASLFLVFAEMMNDPSVTLTSARDHVVELLADAEELDDEQAVTACLLGLGQMEFWLGHLAAQRAISERLQPSAGRLRTAYRIWVAGGYQSAAYFGDMPVADGLAMVPTIQAIVGDSVEGSLMCEMLVAALHAMADQPAEFDAAMARWDRMWADVGRPQQILGQGHRRAASLFRLGRIDDALDVLRSVKGRLDALGETGLNSTTTAFIGLILALDGRIDEAVPYIDEARTLAASDDFGSLVPIGCGTALIESARGDHAAALAAVDEAERLIRATDFADEIAETLAVRGFVLLAAGRHAEANAALEEAFSIWERKGNVASIARVRERLATRGQVTRPSAAS
jgi:tetratricopeptide (TPR) repeat protein